MKEEEMLSNVGEAPFANRSGPSSDETRRELREEEAEIEERKYGHLGEARAEEAEDGALPPAA